MKNIYLPIIASLFFAALVIAAFIAWPQYNKYQEQTARRECAAEITQKKQEYKQASAEWEQKCASVPYGSADSSDIKEDGFFGDVLKGSNQEFVRNSHTTTCESLYGKKPADESMSIDDERKLIQLCVERKGYR